MGILSRGSVQVTKVHQGACVRELLRLVMVTGLSRAAVVGVEDRNGAAWHLKGATVVGT